MKYGIIVVSAIFICSAALSGCFQPVAVLKTTLTQIRIGDMPTDDFDHIWINFSEIRIHKSGNNSGWINLSYQPMVVDLLYLHINNITELLAEKELEIGNYTKLWINITNATGQLNNTGEIIYFTIPSGTLKIQQLFKLDEGKNNITVDIDLNS